MRSLRIPGSDRTRTVKMRGENDLARGKYIFLPKNALYEPQNFRGSEAGCRAGFMRLVVKRMLYDTQGRDYHGNHRLHRIPALR